MSSYVSVDKQRDAIRCHPCIVNGNYLCNFVEGAPCSFCLAKKKSNCHKSSSTIDSWHSTREPIRQAPPWPGRDIPTQRHPDRMHEVRVLPDLTPKEPKAPKAPIRFGHTNAAAHGFEPDVNQTGMPQYPSNQNLPATGPVARRNHHQNNPPRRTQQYALRRQHVPDIYQTPQQSENIYFNVNSSDPGTQELVNLQEQNAELQAKLAVAEEARKIAEQQSLREREERIRERRSFDRQRSRSPNRGGWDRNHRHRDDAAAERYSYPTATSNPHRSNESYSRHDGRNYSQNRFNYGSHGPGRQNYTRNFSNDDSFSRSRQNNNQTRLFNARLHQNYNQNFFFGDHQNHDPSRFTDRTFDGRRQNQKPAVGEDRIKQEPGTKPEPNVKREPSPW